MRKVKCPTLTWVIVLLAVLVSCQDRSTHIGKYVNESNSSIFVELTADGKYFTHQFGGKYTIQGTEIIFEGPMGMFERGKIRKDSIVIKRKGDYPVLPGGTYRR